MNRFTPNIQWMKLLLGLVVFAAGYVLLNDRLLVERVLYRWAAADYVSAVENFLLIGLQAGLLLMVFVFVGRRVLALLLGFIAVSALTNIIYNQLVGTSVDQAAVFWMLSEARSLGLVTGEFSADFMWAGLRLTAAFVLMFWARRLILSCFMGAAEIETFAAKTPIAAAVSMTAFVGIDAAIPAAERTRSAEINLYSHGVRALLRDIPARDAVGVTPKSESEIKNIIWLVDESVGYDVFQSLVDEGKLATVGALDLGPAMSLANCSAQSNALMRWGVDVDAVSDTTDMRTNPSIWGYAQQAGYRTLLIDGQVTGGPQNYVWEPERAMIDEFLAMQQGIDTDRAIAERLNADMKSNDRLFAYVVLRGAHYQYKGNYPAGSLSGQATLDEQYREAVRYSKYDFFTKLMDGVDRSKTVVVYTADHGQVVKKGIVPHCNIQPYAEEFNVPLTVFLPDELEKFFRNSAQPPYSQSQIFPTMLGFMGYDKAYAEDRYDTQLPAKGGVTVTFGKNIIKSDDASVIDLWHNRDYLPYEGR